MSLPTQEEGYAELTSLIHRRIAELVTEHRKWKRMHALHAVHTQGGRNTQPATMARERVDELALDLRRWRRALALAAASEPSAQAQLPPVALGYEATFENILELVGRKYRVSRDEILSRTRNHRPTQARLAAVRLLREFTKLSYPEIGRVFDRNHATIVSACRTTQAWDLDDLRVELRRREAKRATVVTTVAYQIGPVVHQNVLYPDQKGVWPLKDAAWTGGGRK